MDVMITIFVLFVVQISANVCNTSYGTCCANFKMVEGVCQPCIGSFGRDCIMNCSTGFFGFGCGSTCYCKPDQLCDSKIGCVNKNGTGYHPMYGIFIGISIVSATVCIILIIYIINRRRRTKNTPATVVDTCRGQAIEISNPQSSINDSSLGELTSMHCNKISPLSGNFSCRSSNIKMYSHNQDNNISQEPRESWCSSNYYSGSYDKCHEMDKYDCAKSRISTPFRRALLSPHVRYSSQRFIIEEEGEYCEPRKT